MSRPLKNVNNRCDRRAAHGVSPPTGSHNPDHICNDSVLCNHNWSDKPWPAYYCRHKHSLRHSMPRHFPTKRDTRMRRQAQKERFSLRVDEGIEKQTVERLPVGHFPTQKFLKIVPSTSSVVTSPPVISARWWRHSRKSCATKSPESPDCNPCRTRRTSSSAAESAA